jgi:hypothetical protein
VPLTIYRRHSQDCQVHNVGLKTQEKRFFQECECPIWLTGTTDTERYPRQSTGLRDWKAAEAKLRSLNAESKDTAAHGPTIADCIKRFLDAHAENIGDKAHKQHRLTLNRLQDFAYLINGMVAT